MLLAHVATRDGLVHILDVKRVRSKSSHKLVKYWLVSSSPQLCTQLEYEKYLQQGYRAVGPPLWKNIGEVALVEWEPSWVAERHLLLG
jgi:hypothetical protein